MTVKSANFSPDSQDPSEIEHALERLRKLTRRLRINGQIVVLATLATIAGSISLNLYRALAADYITRTTITAALGLIGLVAVYSIVFSITFENTRKYGDVLFKEISDELQWYIRFRRRDEGETDISEATAKRPDLEARLALRSFAQTSDLPLIPGAYGPLFYVLINVVSAIVATIPFLLVWKR